MTRPAEVSAPGHPRTVRAAAIAAEIHSALQSLAIKDTPNIRAVRRAWSRTLRQEPGQFVLAVAMILRRHYGYHFVPYELIANHHGAYRLLTKTRLEALGRGPDSWSAVDAFARTLAGPAWRDGLIGDTLFTKWAESPNRWWRRAALVSTVALNVRSQGGQGDLRRTLQICRLLVDDHDDMVEKALSWALRELIVHDRRAVEAFLEANEARLGSRVEREVRNKMQTGLKTPHPASRR
jgi:3-methyladenine DNA glycosylase AlkD